ncbi:hypothetical protein [Rhodanobacter sp. MP7CTX1]|jgi:hypothetical protein|nr:hypothetical protein [Rhodanobacter sp. MP7CTX1]MBB6187300.1 hypothetical protein [Rhodanobacter sp. MP7CTX1]
MAKIAGPGDVVLRKVGGNAHRKMLESGDFSVSVVTSDFDVGG